MRKRQQRSIGEIEVTFGTASMGECKHNYYHSFFHPVYDIYRAFPVNLDVVPLPKSSTFPREEFWKIGEIFKFNANFVAKIERDW